MLSARGGSPANLPEWASGLGSSVEHIDGQWFVDSPDGRLVVAFAERNDDGILDHDVTLPSGETVHNPMRVIAWLNRVVYGRLHRRCATHPPLAHEVRDRSSRNQHRDATDSEPERELSVGVIRCARPQRQRLTARRVGDMIPRVGKLDAARWWAIRPAQNRKPATYRCPLCGYLLHAMTSHMLIAPEGDASRRRHAHTECVQAARQAGRLPMLDEWRKTQPPQPSLLRRAFRR